MEKEGYIKVKELSKGVESITEMKKDHPELVNYDIFFISVFLCGFQIFEKYHLEVNSKTEKSSD